MAGYVVAMTDEILDPEALARYREPFLASLALYGGERVVLAAGRQEQVEGDGRPSVSVIRFATYENALAWYHGPEYAAAREIRGDAARLRMTIADGAD